MKKCFSLFTSVFLIGIFLWMCLTVISGVNYLTNNDKKTNFDSLKKYPYQVERPKQKEGTLEKIYKQINRIQEGVSDLLESDNVAIYHIAEVKKSFDKYIYNYNITTSHNGSVNNIDDSNDLVILHESGGLAFMMDDSNIIPNIDSFVSFAREMADKKVKVLLFIPPDNDAEIDETYLSIYQDYTSNKERLIIEKCNANNVDYLLYSNYIKINKIDETKVFYRTDHHWLPENGLNACKLISEWLNNHNDYLINPEIFNLDRYDIYTNMNPMLGSLGKRATRVYIEPEYMPVIQPKYETDITVFSSKDNKEKTGSIENLLLRSEYLTPTDIYTNTQYNYYGDASHELVEIHNNKLQDGKKILLLKNSYANCVFPFMPNMAEYVSVIDLRFFKGSLETYIEQYNPDTIIVMYNVSSFSHSEGRDALAFDFE